MESRSDIEEGIPSLRAYISNVTMSESGPANRFFSALSPFGETTDRRSRTYLYIEDMGCPIRIWKREGANERLNAGPVAVLGWYARPPVLITEPFSLKTILCLKSRLNDVLSAMSISGIITAAIGYFMVSGEIPDIIPIYIYIPYSFLAFSITFYIIDLSFNGDIPQSMNDEGERGTWGQDGPSKSNTSKRPLSDSQEVVE